MKSPVTHIVVPNWNGKAELARCLPSLLKQTVPAQVVVVDNGSSDGSSHFIKSKFPEVTLIELSRNHGFTGGVNAGIRHALAEGADYIALFNNDAVAEPDWLKHLLTRIKKDPKIGIVTGKLLKTGGQIDSVGEAYSIWGLPFPVGRNQSDSGQFNKARLVTAASGGASLYRAKMLKQIGLFDQEFFAYYEDVDLALRAQSRRWQVWFEPTAIARHRVGGTSRKLPGFAAYHSLKNTYYLYAKNMPAKLYWKYLPRFLISVLLVSWRNLFKGNFKAFFVVPLRLLLSFPYMAYQRLRIQHQRQISAAQFDKLLYRGAPPTSRTLTKLSKLFDKKYNQTKT